MVMAGRSDHLTTQPRPQVRVGRGAIGVRGGGIFHWTDFFPFSLNSTRKFVVNYKRKYVHEVLVNHLPRKKVWLGEQTVPP